MNTLPAHRRVEAQLCLLDPGLTPGRMLSVIRCFYGFWANNEEAIDVWSSAFPSTASALFWPRRRRAQLFACDLVTLGLPQVAHGTVPRVPRIFEHVGQAEVLGWLYVAEGSTLGGSLIDRHIRSVPGLAPFTLGCFTPYCEGPGAMWQSYKECLEHFVGGNAARRAAVIAAAVMTFDTLQRWLAPLALDSAA